MIDAIVKAGTTEGVDMVSGAHGHQKALLPSVEMPWVQQMATTTIPERTAQFPVQDLKQVWE